MPCGARDHHVGRIGHAELGLAVGDEALDVGRLAVLDRHLQAGIGVEALLLRDVERRELHVRPEAEEQRHRSQRLSNRCGAGRIRREASGKQDGSEGDQKGARVERIGCPFTG